MIRKSVSFFVVLLLCGISPASDSDKPAVRMHLPRSVRVRGQSLRLGLVGVIRGSDAKLCKKVSDVTMGRMPLSGEKIIIDRRTILSRLATSRISASMIRITGAEKVAVILDETTFEAAKLGRHKFRFKNKLLSLDASTIDLCASLFDWAKFRRTKGAVKLHLVLDHDGYLPSVAVITDGKCSDIRAARVAADGTVRDPNGLVVTDTVLPEDLPAVAGGGGVTLNIGISQEGTLCEVSVAQVTEIARCIKAIDAHIDEKHIDEKHIDEKHIDEKQLAEKQEV